MAVPSYDLITAQPRQRHFETGVIDGLRNEVSIEPVDGGTLHCFEEPGHVAVFQRGRYPLEDVPVVAGSRRRLTTLVTSILGGYGETGEASAKPMPDSGNGGWSTTGGQEQCRRHVGDEMQVNGICQCSSQPFLRARRCEWTVGQDRLSHYLAV